MKKQLSKEESNKEKEVIRLCGDVIFKAIFLREKEVLLKMIYDITDISETMYFEEVLTGYELEPYKLNGKVNRSDMLVKLGNTYYLNTLLNYQHESNVMYRNMIQLFRICGQITESGMADKDVSLKKVGQLNFNTFANSNNKEIQRGMYADDDGKLINNFLTFWNIDIVKCYKKVYNNIKEVQKLPKAVRWGALLYADTDNIEYIKKVIGDDLLSMKEKEKLVKRINEVKNNKQIIQEWMVAENNRMREENVLRTAREDGLKEGIKKGIKQGIQEGIEQGIQEGREQGIQEGIEQGIQEEKIQSIRKMLQRGDTYEDISEITGKTTLEIEEIAKSIDKV